MMDLNHADATFQKLQADAGRAYQKVYADICSQLKGSSSRGLGGEIARLEAKALNQLILTSMDKVEQAVIAEMIANGCKEYLTQAGWTEIQQTAGVPRTELCRVQVDTSAMPTAESEVKPGMTEAAKREMKKRIDQYEAACKKCGRTALVGAAVVGVSLIVPGWEVPIYILLAAGGAAVVVGGVGAAYNGAKLNQTKSKFERDSAPVRTAPSYEDQLDHLLAQVTDSQCKRNLQLYCEWLDTVKRALISECEKLAAM